ncbi:MAG: bifunctional riboflavin kinase/FAD synthetase [Tissierellia bacterium]|nr:bifunctional riboflavin kinase/FAD synthetase [Tissierellia bacterium]
MQIVNLLDLNETGHDTTIALGNFDGLHLAHQALIKEAIEFSKANFISSSVLLFNQHTNLLNDKTFRELTPFSYKCSLIENYGINNIYTIPFNNEIMQMMPKDFLELLTKKLRLKYIVIGNDYRFGRNRRGDIDFLKKFAKNNAIEVKIIDDIKIDNLKISSTKIRELISKGNLSFANQMLGREYMLRGKVVHGKGFGKQFGFATANLELSDNFLIPKEGVYKTHVLYENKLYNAVTSVGRNLTFNESDLRIESHILNFNKTIYGEILDLFFVDYIRPMIKFENSIDLIKQMKTDLLAWSK